MRVFLINPPADNGVKQVREGRCMQRAGAWTAIWTPISLAYCAAVLRKEGVEVKLVDCIVDETDFNGLEKDVEDFCDWVCAKAIRLGFDVREISEDKRVD